MLRIYNKHIQSYSNEVYKGAYNIIVIVVEEEAHVMVKKKKLKQAESPACIKRFETGQVDCLVRFAIECFNFQLATYYSTRQNLC